MESLTAVGGKNDFVFGETAQSLLVSAPPLPGSMKLVNHHAWPASSACFTLNGLGACIARSAASTLP